MDIYVINLTRAPERRAKMESQLIKFGLPFILLNATDGKSLTAEERDLVDHERRKRITPYPLTDNEIGCWISHRRAMEELLASGKKMAAILEDDAELAPQFRDALAAIEGSDRRFDVIDLHRNFRRGEIFIPVQAFEQGVTLGRVGYTHMNLTAYVISKEGARKFLAYAPRFAHAVDKELHRYWANGLDLYGLEKPVARQEDGGYSYIDETRGQDRPEARPRYPDADRFSYRFARKWTKLGDSLRKRAAFRKLVRGHS